MNGSVVARRFGGASLAVLAWWAAAAHDARAQAPQDEAGLVEEVVITARRREERLQETPASVTSLSSASLEAAGLTNLRELSVVTPGLNFRQSGVNALPNIRGIGSTNVSPGDEANVSTYVDGVYMSAQYGNTFDFNNIERVEVLKGPQGTLFGRNSTGGAISVFTKDPTHDPQLKVFAGYGSFNRIQAGGYASAGLTENLAADVAIAVSDDQGYVRDIYRGDKLASKRYYGIRSKWLFTPNDDLRVTLSMDATQGDNITGTSSQTRDGNSRANTAAQPLPTEPWDVALTSNPTASVWVYGGSLRVEQDFGVVQFMSLTSARRSLLHARTDSDAGPPDLVGSFAAPQRTDTYSQEFQLSSPATAERFTWVAGLYGIADQAGYVPIYSGTMRGAATRIYTDVKTNGWAAFGEATWELVPNLSVTGGLRYSWERKSIWAQTGTAAPVARDATWDDLTPRVVVRYIAPEVVNLYGSYSKGFKSGAYSATSPTVPPVDPETVDAYELGAKSLASNRWRLNGAVFHYAYKNIQVLAYQPGGTSILQNAAEATIYGGELEAAAALTPELDVRLATTYTHGRYDSFPRATVTVPRAGGLPGNDQVLRDVSGNTIVRTPEWTVSGGLTYTVDAFGGRAAFNASALWSDAVYWDPLNRIKEDPYAVVNIGASWTSPDQAYKLTLYANNLFDEAYAASILTSATADSINYAEPRFVGVRLDWTIR